MQDSIFEMQNGCAVRVTQEGNFMVSVGQRFMGTAFCIVQTIVEGGEAHTHCAPYKVR